MRRATKEASRPAGAMTSASLGVPNPGALCQSKRGVRQRRLAEIRDLEAGSGEPIVDSKSPGEARWVTAARLEKSPDTNGSLMAPEVLFTPRTPGRAATASTAT